MDQHRTNPGSDCEDGVLSFGGIKRDAADVWFSKCVRLRARWRCEVCDINFKKARQLQPSKQFTPSDTGLHCSHYFGRRHKATRTEPLNCISACMACHTRLGANPHEYYSFMHELLGEEVYDIIAEKHRQLIPKAAYPVKEIAKHFKSEYFRQVAESETHDGRLEFRGWV